MEGTIQVLFTYYSLQILNALFRAGQAVRTEKQAKSAAEKFTSSLKLGFGSEIASRGVLNIAGGLWNSGTLLHGYDKGVSVVGSGECSTAGIFPSVVRSPDGEYLLGPS